MSLHINRKKYAGMYGPTTGDKIRLADTELIIEIEKDFTVYGDEAKFGGGKTIRDGMAQSATATRDEGVPDLVITSVITFRPALHSILPEARKYSPGIIVLENLSDGVMNGH